ncbi:putative methyltransferase [Medicago truncatula]|uniref:Isoflavone-7-O-methyltransferase n=1 Tax=Medicago truncatula TaxID=3880 RepID=A0A072UPM0_MEDTR|nr:isoflavone 4'-O-methyltransferase-like isoform X2 [Medicago truncatula]KEH30963.1 isoflavone-7-O-methyltransferase [Medicago truncatula]RHN62340.1 putative methyltransferase [Medicago truncatula]
MAFTTNCSEESELYHAQIHLYKHVYNFVSSMALKSAMELGIADAIHNHGKPMTLSELASSLKLHPSKVNILYRFLRLLTHNGFFTKTTVKSNEEEETAYGLTPSSKLLISGKSTCLSTLIEGALHASSIDMWKSSKKWFNEDKEQTLFECATGENYWDFLNKDSESGTLSLFQDAMAADSRMFKLALHENKNVFEGLESLVDVAGGTGAVTKLIHEAFPQIKCTVFDQPQVVGNLTGNENLNFVSGDMFKSIPPADAVLLKWVLHDWNDELSLKILKNSKEAISHKGKDGKVIIIDISIDETSDDRRLTELQLEYDLVMLTMFLGKERTKQEWEKLIYDAGFSSYKITPISGFKSLVEVYP